MRRRCLSLALALAGLVGCRDEVIDRGCTAGGCDPVEATGHAGSESAIHRALDLLVIVDDSQSAAALASTWAALWPDLGALMEDPESRISLHLKVLSATGCGPPRACTDDGSLTLSSTVCGRARNFPGSLAAGLACMASLPATTCEEARPLDQLRDFAETMAAGADFFRADAYLQVLILAGTDDASAISPALAVEALRAAHPDLSKVLLAVVGPPTDCSRSFDPTTTRLFAAVKEAGGAYVPQCSSSWQTELLSLLAFGKPDRRPLCLGPLRDVNPDAPGLQPLLRVTDESVSEDGASRSGEIAACTQSAPPCWTLEQSGKCPAGQELLEVVRPADVCPGVTHTVVDFLTCAVPGDPACVLPQ